MLLKGGTPILCGDFNIHIEDSQDSIAQRFESLYESKGFLQHIDVATHNAGGILDLILTPKNVADKIPIENIVVDPHTGTTSDHFFITCQIPVTLKSTRVPCTEVKQIR